MDKKNNQQTLSSQSLPTVLNVNSIQKSKNKAGLANKKK